MSGISSFCSITASALSLKGEVLLTHSPGEVSWAKQVYNYLQLDYPKFYKMDRLAQFAFLASEALKKANAGISAYGDDELALLFANSVSSADTDERFEKSYRTEVPSPSLFVYTLPNIVLGELAIRNKWYGENMFYVFPKFSSSFFRKYSEVLLAKGAKGVLAGWVDIHDDDVDVLLFLVEQNVVGDEFTEEELLELYQKMNYTIN
jgi:hypothetical protein